MVHTFEILYIMNQRAATYCAFKLNQKACAYKIDKRSKEEKRMTRAEIRAFLRQIHIRKKYECIKFKGFSIPGIHQMNLLKYKEAPGNYFLYIMIEPEVLLTGENTLDVFVCSAPNVKQLQTNYAEAIYTLFPKAFEGRPPLSQVRFHDQKRVHPDEWKNWGLYNTPYLPLAITSRIDFCADYKLENAALYVEMISKSYYRSRKKNVKLKNLNPFSEDKSHDTLFYDKTSGFCIYDKGNKMWSHDYDNMHNIAQIREDAKDVIRIERPFYKVSKQKLLSLTGLPIPKAEEGSEAPLTLGPLLLMYDERVGLKTLFKEYLSCVLGIKRTEFISYMQNHPDFKWVSLKRFVREMDRLYEAGRITKQRHDTVLKMAYATSAARSVARAAQNCDNGTHIWWGHDEEGKKISILYRRSAENFRGTWKTMNELGMMLLRIPAEKTVLGVEKNDWNAKELDANFIFNIESSMVDIGTMLEEEQSNHFDFLPYRFVNNRGLGTSDPLEIRQNYEDILRTLYLRLQKYIDAKARAYARRQRRLSAQ